MNPSVFSPTQQCLNREDWGLYTWFGNQSTRNGWLVGFYVISAILGYLMPNPLYTCKQFYFKQFSLALVRSLRDKTDQFQTIQSSINEVFVCTQLNVKTVLFQTIQSCISTIFVNRSKCINSSISIY